MTRRSTPQRRIDDEAFPVRVKLLVPEGGFERQFDDLYRWLDQEVGRGEYAFHAATALGLFAAIPAVIFYNKLNQDTETLIGGYESFSDEFSMILSRQLERAA